MSGKLFTISKENVRAFIVGIMFDQIKAKHIRDDVSAYHLMQDEIIIQKNNLHGIEEGNIVTMVVESHSPVSKYELNHIYEYDVHLHDDVSYRMELIDFKVEAVKR